MRLDVAAVPRSRGDTLSSRSALKGGPYYAHMCEAPTSGAVLANTEYGQHTLHEAQKGKVRSHLVCFFKRVSMWLQYFARNRDKTQIKP